MQKCEKKKTFTSEMRVVSWNILAQETLPETAIPFSIRLARILETLFQIDADIIFLQEVTVESFEEHFAPLFHDRHHACHHKSKKRTCSFGNAILWKKTLGGSNLVIERSRCIHVSLINYPILLTNMHLPTGAGLSGYHTRLTHIQSCKKVWQNYNHTIMGGDLNEGLWNPFGIAADIRNLGFTVHDEPKLSCRSFAGNVYDIDHICLKGMKFVGQPSIPLSLPNKVDESHPSDHVPVVYEIQTSS
jgi:endonuclease/exonuclease/phosphatase family metal-dependent hydrolase